MFGRKWKKQLAASLEVSIELLEILEDVQQFLPLEEQKKMDHRLEVLMARTTEVVDGESRFRV
ncbi:UNVERIFIED_ORG: hypothetical protein Xoosp15_207 [Xanthomonas phage Xoo-sp15]